MNIKDFENTENKNLLFICGCNNNYNDIVFQQTISSYKHSKKKFSEPPKSFKIKYSKKNKLIFFTEEIFDMKESLDFWLKTFLSENFNQKNDFEDLEKIIRIGLFHKKKAVKRWTESVLCVEYPENFLYIAMQSKLTDFFICMAKSGVKVVVKTHSEQLITRACLRIAEDVSNEIHSLVGVLFVSHNKQTDSYVLNNMNINEYGEIEDWPQDFFENNDSFRLMEACLSKRLNGINK